MVHVAVVIPTYNEVENMRPLVGRLRALALDLTIVIVDDNSPDGTGAAVEELARNDPKLKLLRRSAKLGLGTAHKEGIRLARGLGAEVVATMDADLSHEPERLPALVEATLRSSGMAIGSRYVRGGSSDYAAQRQVLSRTANLLARLAIGGAPVRDATAGFRCFSRGALERIDWDDIRSEGYSFLVETVATARSQNVPIAEVPIHFRDRVAGVSKISRKEIARGVLTLGLVLYKRVRGVRTAKARRAAAVAAPQERVS